MGVADPACLHPLFALAVCPYSPASAPHISPCFPAASCLLQSNPDTHHLAMIDFRREITILKACRDPNIVAFLVSRCCLPWR